MLLEQNSEFSNQNFHYFNKINNFIECHHSLSFHVSDVTMILFLFKTPHNVLQICHIPCKRLCKLSFHNHDCTVEGKLDILYCSDI